MAIYAHKLGSDERVFVAGLGRPGPAGENGFSPTVAVTAIPGGHRITITDAEGPHTFDVMDGQEGTGDGVTYTAGTGIQITDTEQGKQISLSDEATQKIQKAVTSQTVQAIVFITQAEYDALTTKSATTLYVVPEEG